jgi:hypothetical protein
MITKMKMKMKIKWNKRSKKILIKNIITRKIVLTNNFLRILKICHREFKKISKFSTKKLKRKRLKLLMKDLNKFKGKNLKYF